jgi:hypothetical protein
MAALLASATLCALVALDAACAAPAAVLPPGLVALEQQLAQLKITSMRFSERISVSLPPSLRKGASLLKVSGESRESGEVAFSPPAASVSRSLFGLPLMLRMVDAKAFVYIRKFGNADRGRPWVELGPGGLAEVFSYNLPPSQRASEPIVKIGEPRLVEPPFAELTGLLAGAREVRELGPGMLDGQPVTSFLATLEPAQLEREKIAASRSPLRPRRMSRRQPPIVTLEVSLAPDGLPVRTVVAVNVTTVLKQQVDTTSTLEIPAINFPLVIEAPPPAQTITIKQLQALARQQARHKHRPTSSRPRRK